VGDSVTKALSDSQNLKSLADLAAYVNKGGNIKLVGSAEFNQKLSEKTERLVARVADIDFLLPAARKRPSSWSWRRSFRSRPARPR
jgi:hypothetical protein